MELPSTAESSELKSPKGRELTRLLLAIIWAIPSTSETTETERVLEDVKAQEEDMTVLEEGMTVQEEDIIVPGEVLEEAEEVQKGTVDLDHKYFLIIEQQICSD